MTHSVIIKGLKLYAYHGVLPQERIVGSYFTIDVRIYTDFTRAMQTDELDGTISYADVYDIIRDEMATPSKLLEHVGGRITDRIFRQYPGQAARITLCISKENPPMGAECEQTGVEIDQNSPFLP